MITFLKNKRMLILSVILLIAALYWTYFIFSMSLKSAEESSAMSVGFLTQMLKYIHKMLWFDIEFGVLHHFVRKLAHFTEYTILGILSVGFVKSIKSRPIYSLIYCLFIGIFDEILQFLNASGRAMQIKDMALDFCGSVFGTFVFYFISFLVFAITKKRIKNEKIEHTF